MKKANDDPNWIQVYSGLRFWPTNPDINGILLPDIAHALGFQCRYGGHTRKFYSVAQHCVLVSHLVKESAVELKLAGLMHDATEAYLIDLPRPVKVQMPEYKAIENKLAELIAKKFGLTMADFEAVKKYDEEALSIEAESLMAPLHPDWYISGMQTMTPSTVKLTEYWAPEKAERMFLERFNELWTLRRS